MKKKLLITGCGGYLGSYLIPFILKQKNYEVIGYDIGFFKGCNLYENPEFENNLILKDARNLESSDIENCDSVIHLAGISNDPLNKLTSEKVYDPSRHYTMKIAKLCKSLKKKFIFASSCSVYGAAKTNNYLTEDSKTNPQTGYSLNKLQIEEDLKMIADKNFFPICLRFATVFGVSSRIRFDVVINMLVGMGLTEGKIKLNSDGEAWRPNLYIEDACSSILHFVEYKRKEDDGNILILNIGRNDNNLKIIEIANIIRDLIPNSEVEFLNNSVEVKKNQLFIDRKIKEGKDKRTYKVSFDKAKDKYKFECKFTIKDGIAKMIQDFEVIKLNSEKFKFNGFYRLQYLESLHQKNLIDDNLKWKI